MGDLKFKEDAYKWANNREGEGYIQERLDRFFGFAKWIMHYDKAKLKHILRTGSDHQLLLLASNLLRRETKAKFIFNL